MSEQLPLPHATACQRWRHRRHSWLPTSAGGFAPARYQVREMDRASVPTAKHFVKMHHYSGSWPAVRLSYGLYDTAQGPIGGRLVGVLALGVPMSVGVLTGVFSGLTPYTQSLELSRLVLLDEVPANAETWFAARCFRLAAARGLRGVVAHSDPHPRTRLTPDGPEELFPGHMGTIYQAKGMHYLGRTRRRQLTVLPDGSVLTDRVRAKVRGNEVGHAGVERRLIALGARPRERGEPGRYWLEEALVTIGATVLDHRGNHRYAAVIGPPSERRRFPLALTAYPYPKQHEAALA